MPPRPPWLLLTFLVALLIAYATPSAAQSLQNTSFESGTYATGVPNSAGAWRGDLGGFVTAENGITPFQGTRMMKFTAASSAGAGPSGAAEAIQLVDLAPYASAIATGTFTLTGSMYVNRVAGDSQTDTQFAIVISAYGGSLANYPTNIGSPLARHAASIITDGNPATWQPTPTTSLTLPPNTTYVSVIVEAVENVFNDVSGAEFDGHYADQVSFALAPLPSVSIANAQVTEGNSGTMAMTFPVTASGPVHFPITMNYQTTDGTASVANVDYVSASGPYALNPDQSFSQMWGSAGPGNGQFNDPYSVATDPAGNVYVVEALGNRVQKFSPTGTFIAQWGSTGSGNGQFNAPHGIAIDAFGNVYVTDSANHRIQKFTETGVYLSQWGAFGTGDGQFNYPVGIATDPFANVFVCDYSNNRIQKFTSAGAFVAKWGSAGGGNGQFANPIGIAVNDAGSVFIGDTGNNRIQKFSNAGGYISEWGANGTGDGQFQGPRGMSIDVYGNLYVTDSGTNRIQAFTSAGAFLTKWGAEGSGGGQFEFPVGLTVDGSGNIYVADRGNSRIQKYTQNSASATVIVLVNGDVQNELDETFTVSLSNPVNASLGVTSATGTILNDDFLTCGTYPWVQVSPSGATPTGRSGHSMVFDTARGVAVLFGGLDSNAYLGDTWEWNGAAWSLRSSSGPSPRRYAALGYDPDRGRTVLFGGQAPNGSALGDTWEWDGTTWTLRATTGPPARYGAAMAYDPDQVAMILHGGTANGGYLQENFDQYIWLGQWSAQYGPFRGEAFHHLIWTPAKMYLIPGVDLVYGSSLNSLWVYGIPIETRPGSGNLCAVYDDARRMLILVGKVVGTSGSIYKTWERDPGLMWPGNLHEVASSPPPQAETGAMVYDATRRVTVLFSPGATGATWIYAPVKAVSFEVKGTTPVTGQDHSIQLQRDGIEIDLPLGSPPLTFQWKRSGVTLTDDSHISGATTDRLTIRAFGAADEGDYQVTVANPCGSQTKSFSLDAPVCNFPITTQPVGATATAGSTLTLSVGFSTNGTWPHYWSRDRKALWWWEPGYQMAWSFTQATLTIPSIQKRHAGVYRLHVQRNPGCPFIAGDSAIVVVNDCGTSLGFLEQPTDRVVPLGQPTTFVGTAQGCGTIAYQWRKNSTPIVGATNSAFAIPSVAAADSGTYSVAVTDNTGITVVSNLARLNLVRPIVLRDTAKDNYDFSYVIDWAVRDPSKVDVEWRNSSGAWQSIAGASGQTQGSATVTLTASSYGAYRLRITDPAGVAWLESQHGLSPNESSMVPTAVLSNYPDTISGTPDWMSLTLEFRNRRSFATGTAQLNYLTLGGVTPRDSTGTALILPRAFTNSIPGNATSSVDPRPFYRISEIGLPGGRTRLSGSFSWWDYPQGVTPYWRSRAFLLFTRIP